MILIHTFIFILEQCLIHILNGIILSIHIIFLYHPTHQPCPYLLLHLYFNFPLGFSKKSIRIFTLNNFILFINFVLITGFYMHISNLLILKGRLRGLVFSLDSLGVQVVWGCFSLLRGHAS